MKETKKPFAFIIRKGLFEEYKLQNVSKTSYEFVREEAIETIIKHLNFSDVIVSTTGYISREVYETRERLGQSHRQDFLTVGSMGHSSSIALGIALSKPDRNIFIFDGDGAFLMHQGAIIVNASKKLKNLKHIIFNNEAHDSVGSQPTAVNIANISKLAIDAGYEKSYSVSNKNDLEKILPEFISTQSTVLLEIKVKCGARPDLGRPKEKPFENKKIFMENLNQIDFCYKGAIENLSTVLKAENIKKALIFTGKKSYDSMKHIVEDELNGITFEYYNDFSTNPKKEEVDNAIKKINNEFDIIVAIGGGSVMDFAKAFRYYSNLNKKLIAIPTTCGTGAESTQFSVIYVNGIKTSLDKREILPDYAIVDSQFVENNPKYLKACTAMDAYCQAIESYWAVKSTHLSREYAKEAIILCRDNIIKYVNSSDITASDNMVKASHLAGKAINISRTTASHALSYKITSEYGIPHGHAVALTIGQLMKINNDINELNCNDNRGVSFVKDRMLELKELISDKPMEYFENLFQQIGLEYDFGKLGIKDIALVISSVNVERLGNNPVKLNNDDISSFFKGV